VKNDTADRPWYNAFMPSDFMPFLSYLVIAVVAVGETIDLPFGVRLAVTIALVALFTIMHTIARHTERTIGFVAASAVQALCALCVMVTGASPSYGIALFFVLSPFLAWRLPLWVSIASAVLGLAASSALLAMGGEGYQMWFPTVLGRALGFVALIGFAVMYQRSRQEQAESEQLLAELTDAQTRIRDVAILKERDRLAREMHDAVGHRLTVATVLLESAGRLIPTDPDRAVQVVESSRTQVHEGLEELRAAVRALITREQRIQSVGRMLEAIVDVYSQATQAKVTLSLQPEMAEPDHERKMVLVRTAQEALTNAQKHSSATVIALSLSVQAGAYLLTCADNGRGPSDDVRPPAQSHFGLENLRARAAELGGTIDLGSSDSGGAVLRLKLPMEGERGDG